MTLYLLKVLLQSYLSIPITQKCQILSCDTLVANELYVVMYQKSLCQVSYMCLFAGGRGGGVLLFALCSILFIFHFGDFCFTSFYIILFDHISFHFAPFDFVTIFIFVFYYILSSYMLFWFASFLFDVTLFYSSINFFIYFILHCCLLYR